MPGTSGVPAADEIVLVTGGSSGIGAGLASRFHARGARVVVAGRDRARLRVVATTHPGMEVVVMDVSDAGSVGRALSEVGQLVPHLTTVINNAGVQRVHDFRAEDLPRAEDVEREIATNFAGLIHVTTAALPLLRRAARSRVVHVGSGLGLVPLAKAPVYSATKAAVHSFTVSLRRQLAGSAVQVVEIIPPVVETGLHRGQATPPPQAMPVEAFLDAAMKGLDSGRDEIPVGLARVLRIGARLAPSRFLSVVNRTG